MVQWVVRRSSEAPWEQTAAGPQSVQLAAVAPQSPISCVLCPNVLADPSIFVLVASHRGCQQKCCSHFTWGGGVVEKK